MFALGPRPIPPSIIDIDVTTLHAAKQPTGFKTTNQIIHSLQVWMRLQTTNQIIHSLQVWMRLQTTNQIIHSLQVWMRLQTTNQIIHSLQVWMWHRTFYETSRSGVKQGENQTALNQLRVLSFMSLLLAKETFHFHRDIPFTLIYSHVSPPPFFLIVMALLGALLF